MTIRIETNIETYMFTAKNEEDMFQKLVRILSIIIDNEEQTKTISINREEI